jgi:iron-sulfur cluster repair protein YtfE (RIC family)
MTARAPDFTALFDTLSREHAELLPEMERLGEETISPIANLKAAIDRAAPKLTGPLDEHIANEERVLFPAYTAAGGDAGVLVFFVEEHREILSLRDSLVSAVKHDREYDEIRPLVARLTEVLSSHMIREDAMLFPTMREVL